MEEEELSLTKDPLVNKAFRSKRCSLLIGRKEETKEERTYREERELEFLEYVDIPDILDHPEEFQMKIKEAISVLNSNQIELVDLLRDGYRALVCIDPSQISVSLSRDVYNVAILPIVANAEEIKDRLALNEIRFRELIFFITKPSK